MVMLMLCILWRDLFLCMKGRIDAVTQYVWYDLSDDLPWSAYNTCKFYFVIYFYVNYFLFSVGMVKSEPSVWPLWWNYFMVNGCCHKYICILMLHSLIDATNDSFTLNYLFYLVIVLTDENTLVILESYNSFKLFVISSKHTRSWIMLSPL